MRSCFLIAFLVSFLTTRASSADDWVALMIDDHWIAERQNVTRRIQQPKKHRMNPLIRGERAWAPNPYCYGSVIFDREQRQFRFWYMSYNAGYPLAERTPILYATSKDGIAWHRPKLNVIPFRGSKSNNIVMSHYGHHDLYSPSVLKDDQDPDPQRRYKMIWWDFPKGPRGYRDDGMCVAFSPDGIHWNKYKGNPVLSAKKKERSISDVMSVMYDKRTKKFVAYTKGWAEPWPAFRQIVRTESSDFIHWSEPQVVIRHAFNKSDPQSYGMVVSEYEGTYLGLLCSYKKPGNETIDIQLAVSHNNRDWKRVADQATFLPLGRSGTWDDGMLFCAPLITHNKQVLIYYGGWDGPHNTRKRKAAIGLATLPRDRFASLSASDSAGTVTTKALPGKHQTLTVNADVSKGTVVVEVLNAQGKVLDGFNKESCRPIQGNGELKVEWRGQKTLPTLDGLRLKFTLRNARLYAFRLGE